MTTMELGHTLHAEWVSGASMSQIARSRGVTKQYVSKVIAMYERGRAGDGDGSQQWRREHRRRVKARQREAGGGKISGRVVVSSTADGEGGSNDEMS